MPMLLSSAPRTTRFALVLAAMLAGAPTVNADDLIRERVVSVTASGELLTEPDIARISLGVVSEAKTARAALAENNKKFAAVLDSIKALGIAPW